MATFIRVDGEKYFAHIFNLEDIASIEMEFHEDGPDALNGYPYQLRIYFTCGRCRILHAASAEKRMTMFESLAGKVMD